MYNMYIYYRNRHDCHSWAISGTLGRTGQILFFSKRWREGENAVLFFFATEREWWGGAEARTLRGEGSPEETQSHPPGLLPEVRCSTFPICWEQAAQLRSAYFQKALHGRAPPRAARSSQNRNLTVTRSATAISRIYWEGRIGAGGSEAGGGGRDGGRNADWREDEWPRVKKQMCFVANIHFHVTCHDRPWSLRHSRHCC